MTHSERRFPRYHNFILGLREEPNALPTMQPVWHYRLENPHTGERTGFQHLDELITYLQAWTEADKAGDAYTPPSL